MALSGRFTPPTLHRIRLRCRFFRGRRRHSMNKASGLGQFATEGDNRMKLKIGVFGIGLDTYWPQFSGLRQQLEGYLHQVVLRLSREGTEIINGGLVDNDEKSAEAADFFKQSRVDAVVIYITTYALSSTVLPLVQKLNVPVLVLALQPAMQIPLDEINKSNDRGTRTGQWLAHCQACSAPELVNVFQRADIPFELVVGFLDDDIAWRKIEHYLAALRLRQRLGQTNVGVLGHYYNGMYDVYSDMTHLSAKLGVRFKILEICELVDTLADVTADDIKSKYDELHSVLDVDEACEEYEIARAVKTSIVLDKLVTRHK